MTGRLNMCTGGLAGSRGRALDAVVTAARHASGDRQWAWSNEELSMLLSLSTEMPVGTNKGPGTANGL